MNNLDMAKLMSLLSKMDKKDLEKGLKQASSFLKSNDANTLLNNLNNNNNNKT